MTDNPAGKPIYAFLEEKYQLYCRKEYFMETDPIQVPHRFSRKEDIEIAGFLAATIAWGQRKAIISNAFKLISLMDNDPYLFLMNSPEKDWKRFENFVHRTFNGTDCITFLNALKNIYQHHGGLENIFSETGLALPQKISFFKKIFFSIDHLPRTRKHIADPMTGSAAKRLCMFLRWMVRPADSGTDFGIWKQITPSQLFLPLDVHSGNVARKLGLLQRTQNDWKAVEELTLTMRKYDAADPCKYDYALFGLGAFERF